MSEEFEPLAEEEIARTREAQQRESWRLFSPELGSFRGFELVHRADEHGHAQRVYAKRRLFGMSPALWLDTWIADSPAEATDLFDKLVGHHKSEPDFSNNGSIAIEQAERAHFFHGLVDGQRSFWVFVQNSYVVSKVAGIGVKNEEVLLLSQLRAQTGWMATLHRRRRTSDE